MKSNRFFQFALSFAIALALTISLVALVACGGDIPDGRYIKRGSDVYWEFSGDKATYFFSRDYPALKGTYKIDKDGLFIFTLENGEITDKKLFAIEGRQLLLGHTQYTKQ